jgi:hypothetical protein
MTHITLAQWQTTIKQMQSDYELAHKYKIAGKLDLIFEYVAEGINNASNFDALKRARTDEIINLHRISISDNDADTKQKLTGQAKIGFIQQSLRALQAIAQTGDAKAIAKAANSLSTELSDAVTAYTAGMANVPDAVKDPNFIATAGKLADGLKNLLAVQHPRLARVHVLYSVDSVHALKTLGDVRAALAAALAPPAAAAAGDSSGSGTDILA